MTTEQQTTNTKPLSQAQRRRFTTLVERRDQAQRELQEFFAYLREEHDVAGDGWDLTPDLTAFVSVASVASQNGNSA